MDEHDWNDLNDEICRRLSLRSNFYVTPLAICALGDLQNGQVFGTANYIQVNADTHLLTCAHVVEQATKQHLAHLPVFGDCYHLITGTWLAGDRSTDAHMDVALTRMPAMLDMKATRCPLRIKESTRDVLTGDMVFLMGYPHQGSWMSLAAKTLLAPSAPYLTACSSDSVDGFSVPDALFAIEYPMHQKVRTTDGKDRHLRNAPGLSGSIAIGVPRETWLSGDLEQCLQDTFIAGLITLYGEGRIIGIKHSVVLGLVEDMVIRLESV